MRIQQGRLWIAAAMAVVVFSGPTSNARSLQPASPEVLQRVAARLGSTVLSYWVTDGGTAVTAVDREGHVTSQSVDVTRARLQQLVELTRDGGNGDSYRALYDLLITPVRGALPGRDSLLTIIPDGPLNALSFAALSNENGRYLLEDFRLHYLPAGSPDAPAPAVASGRDRFLFVANSAPASREVRAIIRTLRLLNPVTLSGKDATPRAVRAAMGKARVAHFAMEGLTPDLIAGQQLSADLVVLSACCAGSSEEAMALSSAFMTAGARNVLRPLGKVREEVWEPLMTRFYEQWQANGDKSAALRGAQISVLHDLRAGRFKVNTPSGDTVLPPSPGLWANAVLVGEP